MRKETEFEKLVKEYLENAGWRIVDIRGRVNPDTFSYGYSCYPDHKRGPRAGCGIAVALLSQLREDFEARRKKNPTRSSTTRRLKAWKERGGVL